MMNYEGGMLGAMGEVGRGKCGGRYDHISLHTRMKLYKCQSLYSSPLRENGQENMEGYRSGGDRDVMVMQMDGQFGFLK